MKKLFLFVFTFCNGVFATSATVNVHLSNYVYHHIEKHPQVVMRFLLKNAAYNVEAAYMLGIFLLDIRAYEFAEHFLQIAAEKKFAPAINALADFYYASSKNKALSMYKQAAELGFAPSQFNAGVICMEQCNYKEAVKYFQQAAENKDFDPELKKIAKLHAKKAIKKCKKKN